MDKIKSFPVIVFRMSPCEHDARINKLAFHLQRLGLTYAIICYSPEKKCNRKTNLSNYHFTINNIKLRKLKYIPILQFIYIIIQTGIIYIRISKIIKKNFHCKTVIGADFDGFIISCFAFPMPSVKKVFEIYDPWSTLYKSKLITLIEKFLIWKADYVILPSVDCRIKPKKRNLIALGNEIVPNLAIEIFNKHKIRPDVLEFVRKNKFKYLLTGGQLNSATEFKNLLQYFTTSNIDSIVVVSDQINLNEKYKNINFFQLNRDWVNWLYLLKYSKAVWIYYNPTYRHYESKISPNKYWECVLFNVPMIVYSLSNFGDRSKFEPEIYELGVFSEIRLKKIIEGIKTPKKRDYNIKIYDYLNELEVKRDQSIKVMLEHLKIN